MTDIKPADPRGDAALYARQAARMLSGEHDQLEVIAQALTAAALALVNRPEVPRVGAVDPAKKRQHDYGLARAHAAFRAIDVDPERWQLGIVKTIIAHEQNRARPDDKWAEVFEALEHWLDEEEEK